MAAFPGKRANNHKACARAQAHDLNLSATTIGRMVCESHQTTSIISLVGTACLHTQLSFSIKYRKQKRTEDPRLTLCLQCQVHPQKEPWHRQAAALGNWKESSDFVDKTLVSSCRFVFLCNVVARSCSFHETSVSSIDLVEMSSTKRRTPSD
jgi:hypothetical protein